ncbi:hypothetical protein C8A01DRAFT_48204 [Parachaetomium inaequale]|uniref:Cytochrome b5 heme-binding domain-containing protein n=1 Tax=Parachaetomium inaequale TaxID=2588326 RepID=A0AAN6PBY5_9PEZI|nr:hypothetical protein C8A01DRAFT_48204 [Parachaetomium inaequale]
MAEEASARRRKPEPKTTKSAESDPAESQDETPEQAAPKKSKKKSAQDRLDDDNDSSSSYFLDTFRVLTFLVLAYVGLSYLVSSGETYSYGIADPSKYTKLDWWKKQFTGPIYLTPAQLATYDGTDPTKPIYLAINGTIYDVSSNRRTYGPGGSYQYLSGCDAARAYITGCFAEDRTPDLRGVEDMFLPIDDPAVDGKYWSAAELRELKKKERAEAERKVHEGLAHWVGFFKNSPKYDFVGYVKRPEGWPGTEPRRQLCAAAAKGRKRRVAPGTGGK